MDGMISLCASCLRVEYRNRENLDQFLSAFFPTQHNSQVEGQDFEQQFEIMSKFSALHDCRFPPHGHEGRLPLL